MIFCVVSDGLDSKYAFAFAIYLNGKLAKMDFENRQIIDRSLEHGFDSGAFALSVFAKWAFLVAKNALNGL